MFALFKVIFIFYFFTSGYFAEGFGLLQNVQYSDECLHVKKSSTENNADLEIATCDTSQPDQQLDVENWANYGNTPGQIIFRFNQKCLTVNSGGQSNGDLVNQYDCTTDATNQLWKIVGSYDGTFQLQNVRSSKCLTAEGGGSYTDQWECIGESAAPHQTWRIVKTLGSSGSSSGSGGSGGVFAFENVHYNGKCLNAADGFSGTGSLNVVNCDTTSPTQLLAATNLASIYGSITFYGTNLCLNVYGESQSNGGQIGSYSCSTSNAQNEKWGIQFGENNLSAFQIVSGFSGKCLTAESDGTSIDQWDCTDYEVAPHQWWKFNIPSSPLSGLPSGSLLESASFPNQCLRIQSRSQDNNAELQLMSCNEADSAQVLNMNTVPWDDLSETPVTIFFQSSSKCLTVNGAQTENGVHINQYDCVNPSPGNQQWKVITTNNDDYEELYELQNIGSEKCLTAEGGGSYMDQWECYNYKTAPHQFWKIRPIHTSSAGAMYDDTSLYWQCNYDTGMLLDPTYSNLTCGRFCADTYDGTKGYSGGYCYKGYGGYRYCACTSAPALLDENIKLFKQKDFEGTALGIGSKLYTRIDCVSFDDPLYKEYDNGGLRSMSYSWTVCLKLWFGYNCTGTEKLFNTQFIYHYRLGDIINWYGRPKSISRYYC